MRNYNFFDCVCNHKIFGILSPNTANSKKSLDSRRPVKPPYSPPPPKKIQGDYVESVYRKFLNYRTITISGTLSRAFMYAMVPQIRKCRIVLRSMVSDFNNVITHMYRYAQLDRNHIIHRTPFRHNNK